MVIRITIFLFRKYIVNYLISIDHEYLVYQRGFPDVGAPGKRDLSTLGLRYLLETAVGRVEFCVVVVHMSP